MTHHPHVHMIVPGGGIASDGKRWLSCQPRFLLPVPVLNQAVPGADSPDLRARNGRRRLWGAAIVDVSDYTERADAELRYLCPAEGAG
jgi:hypothetical protein